MAYLEQKIVVQSSFGWFAEESCERPNAVEIKSWQ